MDIGFNGCGQAGGCIHGICSWEFFGWEGCVCLVFASQQCLFVCVCIVSCSTRACIVAGCSAITRRQAPSSRSGRMLLGVLRPRVAAGRIIFDCDCDLRRRLRPTHQSEQRRRRRPTAFGSHCIDSSASIDARSRIVCDSRGFLFARHPQPCATTETATRTSTVARVTMPRPPASIRTSTTLAAVYDPNSLQRRPPSTAASPHRTSTQPAATRTT